MVDEKGPDIDMAEIAKYFKSLAESPRVKILLSRRPLQYLCGSRLWQECKAESLRSHIWGYQNLCHQETQQAPVDSGATERKFQSVSHPSHWKLSQQQKVSSSG